MIDFDVHRSIEDPDDPSLAIAASFGAIEEYLSLLDEFVPQIQAQLRARAHARIQSELQRDDRAEAHEQATQSAWLIHALVPSNSYGPLVFSVWALLEESINRMLGYLLLRKALLSRASRPGHLSQFAHLTSELESGLASSISVEAKILTDLEDLQLVRNVLAHANGSIRGLRSDRRQKLQRLLDQGSTLTIENGTLKVDPSFVRESFRSAETFCGTALKQLALRVPLSGAP